MCYNYKKLFAAGIESTAGGAQIARIAEER
jgi:hypothetical protein